MLQQPSPDDFVIAMGETHTVEEFCEAAFAHVDLDYRKYVRVDSKFYRPTEVDLLIGDPSKAKNVLGWKPNLSFPDLVKLMVDSDIEYLERSRARR